MWVAGQGRCMQLQGWERELETDLCENRLNVSLDTRFKCICSGILEGPDSSPIQLRGDDKGSSEGSSPSSPIWSCPPSGIILTNPR